MINPGQFDPESILRNYCYFLGAEAAINRRINMNGDDREDIANKAGFEKWSELTTQQRGDVQVWWKAGWYAEKDKSEGY